MATSPIARRMYTAVTTIDIHAAMVATRVKHIRLLPGTNKYGHFSYESTQAGKPQ